MDVNVTVGAPAQLSFDDRLCEAKRLGLLGWRFREHFGLPHPVRLWLS